MLGQVTREANGVQGLPHVVERRSEKAGLLTGDHTQRTRLAQGANLVQNRHMRRLQGQMRLEGGCNLLAVVWLEPFGRCLQLRQGTRHAEQMARQLARQGGTRQRRRVKDVRAQVFEPYAHGVARAALISATMSWMASRAASFQWRPAYRGCL